MKLVGNAEDVATIAEALPRARLAAFDLEFASADRLVPALCLLQVAWLDAADGLAVALVDPLAVDVAPIVRALATHPLVVAHAPRQDLGLLATRFGTEMAGLVDTQLAAAFCGLGDQLGLASLAHDLLRVSLAKEQQWTDWEARPLTPEQLVYAEADVRHLPALYSELAGRLGDRLAWVRAESAQIVRDAVAAAAVTADTAWRGVGGARGLDPAGQGALVALAAWRHRVASELDKPLGQVLGDRVLVELARSRPEAVGAVRSWKGLSPLARARADQIIEALAVAPPVERTATARAPSMRAQRWAEMLIAIVQVVAEQTGIAPRLLATRADAEEAARTVDEGGLAAAAELPAFVSWRREVLGTAWEGWLTGHLALIGDAAAPHGVRLVPR